MTLDLPTAFRIRDIRDESPTVRTFTLDGAVQAEPGQFVMVWLPRVNEKPFSLVDDAPITLTIARVGPFTEAAHRLRVGDRLWLRGPYGRGFDRLARPAVLVAGGYGAAPLAFLARRLRAEGVEVAVALGAKRACDLVLAERFRDAGCSVHPATEDGSLGHRGLATDVAARLLDANPDAALYACGPEAMLQRLAHLCRERGVPGQFSMERMMKCGLGVCGSCDHHGLLVCRDGPVFSADQVLAARGDFPSPCGRA
ncbi:MAG: dihydroorotate dehydrogenase electron transfer subunit [Anaerolineales bacterium]